MKIRTGYVSNSSSSSFLICYKSMDSFNKINQLFGFNNFISSLKDADEKSGIEYIKNEIENELHEIGYSYIDLLRENHYRNHCKFCAQCNQMNRELIDTNVYDIMNLVQYHNEKYGQMISKIHENGNKFLKEMNGKYDINDEKYQKYQDSLRKFEGIDEIAKEIYEKWKESGYTVKSIDYADDDHTINPNGCYMEHSFMPFLERYPEPEFYVFRTSNH